jgi:hypothetical protein
MALTPLALSAQGAKFPRCNDGTVATRTGYTACWFHGGVADGKTVAAAKPAKPARAARASSARPKAAAKSRAASSANRSGKVAKKSSKASKTKVAKAKPTKKKKVQQTKQRTTIFGMPVASASKAGASKPRASSSRKTAKAPKGATARCMDGTYTTAQRKKKACSKHGGVAGWIKPDIPPE